MSEIGHNAGGEAGGQLRAFVGRINRLVEERDATNADIREVVAEAKALGFDTKILRKVASLARADAQKVREERAVTETYLHVLGLLD